MPVIWVNEVAPDLCVWCVFGVWCVCMWCVCVVGVCWEGGSSLQEV